MRCYTRLVIPTVYSFSCEFINCFLRLCCEFSEVEDNHFRLLFVYCFLAIFHHVTASRCLLEIGFYSIHLGIIRAIREMPIVKMLYMATFISHFFGDTVLFLVFLHLLFVLISQIKTALFCVNHSSACTSISSGEAFGDFAILSTAKASAAATSAA